MTRFEYVALVDELKQHDFRYFVQNNPSISDEEYDQMYFRVQDAEAKHPEWILPDSPTQTAHPDVANGHKQIPRRDVMLSTQKAQTVEDTMKWVHKTYRKVCRRFSVEWKFDGVSLSLIYIKGDLVEATEGKGAVGNDVLYHVMHMNCIPKHIRKSVYMSSDRIEVRGEVVCQFANLKNTQYKNCRSAAAGIMANVHPSQYDLDQLDFFAWQASGFDLDLHVCRMEVLSKLGFKTSLTRTTYAEEEMESFIKDMSSERSSLDFPVDGVVIKVDDTTQWEGLGRTDHHPKYSIAYKFPAASVETTLRDIQVTVGSTGKRTPVAYFDPVVINGCTYQKASCGSEDALAAKGIHIGDRIRVSLRNDVIPYIESNS